MSKASMPTAGKLVACAGLAALGYWVGIEAVSLLKELSRMGYLPPLGAGIGALVGWMVIGSDTTRRDRGGLSSGLKGAVFFALLFLLSIGIVQMLRLAVRHRYDGPMEAVTDIFGQAIKIGQMLADPMLLGGLAIGAALIGAVASWAGGKWQ